MVQISFMPADVAQLENGTTTIDLPTWAPSIADMDTTANPECIILAGTTTNGAAMCISDGGSPITYGERYFRMIKNWPTVRMITVRYRAVGELVRT